MELTVTRRTEGGRPVVSVSGEVDLHSAPRLSEQLAAMLDTGGGTLVLDLTDVGFLDSTGLGALVGARASATERGGALPLVCTHERILKLFTITGLDGVFDVHPSVQEALDSLPA
jgi:anti-sigma B factor antagonist